MHQLNLEKFKDGDFAAYFQLVSNEQVMAQITERPIQLKEAQFNFQGILARNKKYRLYGTYKVCDRTTNKFIGLGHLTLNERDTEEAEIGYMILPTLWGKGYGSLIAEKLNALAMQTNVTKLKAIIDPDNIPSRKILIKLGFASKKICEIDGLPEEILCKWM